ncbi:MAG: chromosome segregation protein SMC [Bacillota bacterium]|nr:chromosome segregation protein SMC [Bacillota bacterium]
MFLKSLEIRGFKSFADKTELKFKHGVTAVVGPNGSGKSNISDAVRWVLGEQSIKSLRGGKMEDVIFAGTMFRKPVGLAQVAITLDNSDYELPIDFSDVTVSRRLYRSGESEYYINNTICRLRDIQELFMDTGIGKEGYSIIGQGKIDAILSGRPEERRNLLEEAAGIVKFKSRKEDAEKKLENTDQNLIRINDILSTYEERLEPLRLEHEKAKKFIELSTKLTEKEVSMIIHYIQKNDERIKAYSEVIQTIDSEILACNSQKEKLKDYLDKLYEELEEHEKLSASDREKYYTSLNMKQKVLSENQVFTERIANYKENIARYEKEKADLSVKLSEASLQRVTLEEEFKKIQAEQSETKDGIIRLEAQLDSINDDIGTTESELLSRRNEQIELLRKITDFKNEVTSTGINYDNLNKRQEQLKLSCENAQSSLAINTTTAEALEVEKARVQREIQEHEDNTRESKRLLTNVNKDIAEKEKTLKDITQSHNRLEASHNALMNLEKHYEGYNRSVKSLMINIEEGKIQGVKDKVYLLGNVIKVPDGMETAIEIALGGAVSDLITEDDTTAKQLINHLKMNNLGRATFLPLNIIDGKKLKLSNEILKLKGLIGIASDIVQYNSLFTSAVNYVLGRTIICDSMDNALNIAKKTSYNFRIVTLSGDVVNPGGSLTGGSQQNKSTNVLGRKREIKELSIKIEEVKKELILLTEELNSLKKDQNELDHSILNERDQIHFKQIEIARIQGKINAILEDTEKLKQNIKTILFELQSGELKLQQFTGMIQDIEEQKAQVSLQEAENRRVIEELQMAVQLKKDEVEKIKENHIRLKINKAQIDEIVNTKARDMERISTELNLSYSRKDELDAEIQKTSVDIADSQQKIIGNEALIESIDNEVLSYEDKFKEYEVIKIAKKEDIKKKTQEYEDMELNITNKEADRHRQEINKIKYETEKENHFSKLNDEYNLTLAEAQKYKREIDNPDELRKEVASLKSSITELGVVNVGSIEEYESLTEKYTFMNGQREDLINAKHELCGVINEMTAKMKEVFNVNFNLLRVYFNETFRELFKGGSADLILGEGDELTANIDINVQPPGKKLQNINLMSGGEKGLSAIALLFAILKMKPTPFCILDEIEAALDDANVSRYAEFLKAFSENIQFIVITHRKGTMEASDVLYGVTMEEKGVSKIVSVDLSVS